MEKLLEPFMKDHLVALIKKGVSKHPDLIQIVRELVDVDPAHRKISIHGLGWDTTAETLPSIFGKYGEITAFRVVHDPPNRNRSTKDPISISLPQNANDQISSSFFFFFIALELSNSSS